MLSGEDVRELLCIRVASGFERGNVETDNVVVVGRAISVWYRTASENGFKACVGSRKQAFQIFLGLGGFRSEEGIDDFGRKRS